MSQFKGWPHFIISFNVCGCHWWVA